MPPVRYNTCPWKSDSLIATPDPAAPPGNACTVDCALFLKEVDRNGRLVSGACAFAVLAANVAQVNQKLELVAKSRGGAGEVPSKETPPKEN